MEGLHALYDQLRRYMDLKIYVDPSREVKRMWKIKRDVEERGYRMEDVVEEMRKREPYYKRYIDFQKIYADIVIKIGISQFNEKNSYFVESIMKKIDFPLSGIEMPLSISSLINSSRKPMMISYRNDFYYMKNVSRLVFDGLIPHSSIDSLERRIMEYTRFENFIIERSEYVSVVSRNHFTIQETIPHTQKFFPEEVFSRTLLRESLHYQNPGSCVAYHNCTSV